MSAADGPGRGTFRALRVHNFRQFFVGQLLNVTGSWIHTTALAWILVRDRGEATGLGLIVALQFAPLLVLGVWTGALADRLDKRDVLVVANAAAAAVAAVTAVVVGLGHTSVPVLAVLTLLLGLTAAFETPARQSIVGHLVEADDLPSAVGLNGAVMTGSRLAGSAVAGVLIVAVGATACLYVNAVSFLATIVAVRRMRPAEIRPSRRAAAGRGQVRDGLRYAMRRPEVRFPLAAMTVVGTLALNTSVTTPLIARLTFDAGPGLFAAFGAAAGAGSLVGALYAAGRRDTSVRLIGQAAVVFGALTIALAVAPVAGVALGLLFVGSIAGSLYIASTNTRLQTVTEDEYRGRVMSLYSIVFLGSTPVGAVIVARLADTWNPRVAVAVGGWRRS
jgi:MFS family permease